MPALSINAVKGCVVSPDGAEVTITLATKYAGDISISMPTTCRDELITALSANGAGAKTAAAPAQKTAPAAAPARQTAPAAPTLKTPPVAALEPAAGVAAKVQNKTAAAPAATPGNLSVNVPKKWIVAADLEKHNVVIVVFNPQMDNQSGYALSADAAKSMAAALVKNSDALSARGSTARN